MDKNLKSREVHGVTGAIDAGAIQRAQPSPVMLRVADIAPDPGNRPIDDDAALEGLTDSIRVLGLLQPVHVRRQPAGGFQLVDGERRWRAAQKAGLSEVAAFVLSGTEVDAHGGALVGLALNEHRAAAGCLYVARRLREIKNELGLTLEEVAARTGLPLDRVKTYASLFAASDAVLSFIEETNVPLTIAAELVRYEKATNEGRARKLIERYKNEALTKQQIVELRKRATAHGAGDTLVDKAPTQPRTAFAARLERAFAVDAKSARAELEQVLSKLGLRVVVARTDAPDGSWPANSAVPIGRQRG